MRYFIFSFILLFFGGCSGRDKIPEGVLTQDKMTNVLSDMLIADAVNNERKQHDSTININSVSPVSYQQVFSLYKITKDDFFKSYNFYLNHPDLFKVVLDSAYKNIANKVMPSHPSPPVKK
ncbi:MAG: DUF4296 domain-containing protein [Sphingobacteriales bacterium]|nr:DUF4296 domain-containing protein [Sphingobacteriales bacterium]